MKALASNNYQLAGRTGSHVKLRYEHPTNDDDIRVVTVPMHDRVPDGTLRSIAEQCRADDFDAWCRWIDENR